MELKVTFVQRLLFKSFTYKQRKSKELTNEKNRTPSSTVYVHCCDQ